MNLRDLQYLVAVADAGHFGKAASKCNISQPTLSMQLKKLEEYLGVTLFERTNKQVMITAVGKRIADEARAVLQGAEGIRAIARNAQSPFAGDFRLGAFPTLAPYFLPHAIPAISKALPELRLLLVEDKTADLLRALEAGTLDAALIALPVDAKGLTSQPLFDDPFLLAVPRNHALANRKRVTPEDLQGYPLLLLEDGHCLRDQALEVCSLMGGREQDEFRATSLETLRQMVVAGVGITLIPKLAQREGDGLIYIPFAAPAPLRTIGLVSRKTSARMECVDALASLMKKLLF